MSWPSETPVEVNAYAGEIFWILPNVSPRVLQTELTDSDRVPDVLTETFKVAISEDINLTAAEIAAGNEGTNPTMSVPTWETGRRYIFFGVHEDSDNITNLLAGTHIPVFQGFQRVAGLIDGYKWWRSRSSQSVAASGAIYKVVT